MHEALGDDGRSAVRCGVRDDEAELRRFGYAQQLRRSMSAFGNFALSFSIISILTGGVSLYGYGLGLGGPIEMAIGWPVVSVFTLLVALSLAELASAYPTAGALYHWATILGGVRVGWWTAWLNLIGQVAVLAGIDYAFADFLRDALQLPDSRVTVLSLYAAVLVSHGVLNHVGIRAVTVLNELSAWYHLVGTALLVGALALWAPMKPVSFLATRFVSSNYAYPFAYACLVGLLQAQWTFTGYDASAHVSEETHGAQEAAPRGIVNAVWVSGVVGWIMLVVITLAIGDLKATAAAPNPFNYILRTALGSRLGGALQWTVIGAMWFCGLSSVTSNSRMLFAFARDGGPPGARWLAKVGDRYRTPAVAIWVCIAIAFLLAISSGAYSVITSISTIGFYTSYGIPIGLALWARKKGLLERGPWHIGRWSNLVNSVAVTWIVFITVLLVLPPNQVSGYTFGGALVLLLIYDLAWARRHFAGPPALKSLRQTAIPGPLAGETT
jgi:amino acid transporter